MGDKTDQYPETPGGPTAQPADPCIEPLESACERDLIGLAQQGSLEAYGELVLRYQSLAFRIAVHLTGDPAAADDATQEAFLSAYLRLGRFEGETIRPWLLRIVSNACIDVFRHRARMPLVSLSDASYLVEALPSAADLGSPEREYDRAELRQALAESLSSLPAKHRLVVILSDLYELSYQEIAEVVRVPVGTVKSRLSRARAALRTHLQREMLAV